jgi:HEAT repeat protein
VGGRKFAAGSKKDRNPAGGARSIGMGTQTRLLFCILATQCALGAVGMGQSWESAGKGAAANFYRPSSQLKRPECGNLTPIDGCLAQYGVPLTKEGLLAALRSRDPEIRALDEEVLAYRRIKDAIPELFMLLITTYDPDERIRLADALAELGEEQGVETLRRYCDDARVSREVGGCSQSVALPAKVVSRGADRSVT